MPNQNFKDGHFWKEEKILNKMKKKRDINQFWSISNQRGALKNVFLAKVPNKNVC